MKPAPALAPDLAEYEAQDVERLLADAHLAEVVDDWAAYQRAVRADPGDQVLDDDDDDAYADVDVCACVGLDDPFVVELDRVQAMSTRGLLALADALPAAQRAAVLDRIDPSDLSGWEADELVRLAATAMAAVTALQVRARLAAAGSYARLREQAQELRDARDAAARAAGERVPPRRPVRDHSVSALMKIENVGRDAAEGRLAQARDWVTRLPRMFALLEAGQISPDHLRLVRTETAALSEADCHEVERRITGDLDRNPGLVADKARQAAAAVDPQAFGRRHRTARHDRTAYTKPLPDGMALLSIIGPAEQVALRWLELDQQARALRAAGDPRTLEQLRCDLFLQSPTDSTSGPTSGTTSFDERTGEVITHTRADRADGSPEPDADPPPRGGPAGTDPPPRPDPSPPVRPRTFQGRPVTTVVVLDLATLLGGNDDPALIQGLGPIPAEIARELAHGSRSWFRAAVDDSGVVRDHGRLRAPRQDLRDLIIRGKGRLCACGCGQPAATIDHRQEFQHGGRTDEANLDGLATRCHGEKTDAIENHTGWTPTLLGDGTVLWTSPFGHQRRVRPSDLGLTPRNHVTQRIDRDDLDPPPPPREHDPTRPLHPILNPKPPTPNAEQRRPLDGSAPF